MEEGEEEEVLHRKFELDKKLNLERLRQISP